MENLIEQSVIQECVKLFPMAVSEVEAVDLTAQSLYADIKNSFGGINSSEGQLKISRYNYLRDLRKYLYNKRISDLSGFSIGRN